MTYAVVWTDEALRDLESIHAYLAAEVSVARADHVRTTLIAKTRLLASAPLIYPLARRARASGFGYRTIPVWDYVIHYAVVDVDAVIAIAAVEHAHRDT